MGVKRAVDMAFDHVRTSKGPVYTFGPLIHNPQMLERLQGLGVHMLDDIPTQGTGSVVIRAHGIPPHERDALVKAGFDIIDATCPKVVKVQKIIEKYAIGGYAVIILGEKDHPEIIGLNGYADNRARIVLNLEELQALPPFDQAVVVAQTTFNTGQFAEIRNWSKKNHPHYKVINTICQSTEQRQAELKNIAPDVDGFIIVGGLNSGNTRRLAEVARETGHPALHIESSHDLTRENIAPFAGAEKLALTAGASTPNWTIQAVNQTLRNLSLKPSIRRHLITKMLPFLYLVHVPLALAALTLMCQHSHSYSIDPLFPLMAMFYGWSMHVTSKISSTKAACFHTSTLTAFYDNHIKLVVTSCLISGIIALTMGFYAGFAVGLLLALSYILRLLYDFLPLARRISRHYNYFIDMPYSKALCVALAWGGFAAILPVLGYLPIYHTLPVFAWAALLAFARVMCQDLFAMQNDRISGQFTLMLHLGFKTGAGFLGFLLLTLMAWPVVLHLAGLLPSLALVGILCPLLMFDVVMLYVFNREKISLTFKLEPLVSLAFIVSGLLMLIISMFM